MRHRQHTSFTVARARQACVELFRLWVWLHFLHSHASEHNSGQKSQAKTQYEHHVSAEARLAVGCLRCALCDGGARCSIDRQCLFSNSLALNSERIYQFYRLLLRPLNKLICTSLSTRMNQGFNTLNSRKNGDLNMRSNVCFTRA